jgi:hypothetical protein
VEYNAFWTRWTIWDPPVVSKNVLCVEPIRGANGLREEEPFPISLLEAMIALRNDPGIQAVLVWEWQNEDSLLDEFMIRDFQITSQITHTISLVSLISCLRWTVCSVLITDNQK